MRFTEKGKALLLALCQLPLPEDIYFDVSDEGVTVQAYTQENVRKVRAAFGGGILWNKRFNEGCNWWEYSADVTVRRGFLSHIALTFHVNIYACREAPPACRAVTETVDVEEDVPVQFEKRIVQKEVTRWICPETVSD